MRNRAAPGGRNDIVSCGDVVVEERLFLEGADLSMIENHRVRAGEGRFPRALPGKIGFDDFNARIQSRQSRCIGRMLVDGHDSAIAALGQALDQILTHEARAAGDDDLAFRRHTRSGCQSLVL